MTATFPGAVRTYTVKTDLVDHVNAADVNGLQEEVIAIETTLGLGPNISTAPNPASTFVATSTTYADLVSRLANIEIGIVADTHTQYVGVNGGDVISTTNNSVIPLVVKAKSGQTADTFQVQTSSGTVVFNVDSSGVTFASGQILPIGLISTAKVTANSAGLGGSEAMYAGLANSFTVVSGHRYRCTLQVNIGDLNNVGSAYILRLRDGITVGSTQIWAGNVNTIIPLISSPVNFVWYLDNLSTGAHTIAPGIQPTNGAANFQQVASSISPGFMYVEDIGT